MDMNALHVHLIRQSDCPDIQVVDYIDKTVPVLVRMAANRRAGYQALGYRSKQYLT